MKAVGTRTNDVRDLHSTRRIQEQIGSSDTDGYREKDRSRACTTGERGDPENNRTVLGYGRARSESDDDDTV